jgi:hypothetical protein
MSKKSIGLLICSILIFLLIASAMAIENKSANENFTSRDDSNLKSIGFVSGSALTGTDTVAEIQQYGSDSGMNGFNPFLFRI